MKRGTLRKKNRYQYFRSLRFDIEAVPPCPCPSPITSLPGDCNEFAGGVHILQVQTHSSCRVKGQTRKSRVDYSTPGRVWYASDEIMTDELTLSVVAIPQNVQRLEHMQTGKSNTHNHLSYFTRTKICLRCPTAKCNLM